MLDIMLNGFLIELVLIAAVGLQNAFILKQGLRSEHVLATVLVCTFGESLLIFIGITGMSAVLKNMPDLIDSIKIIGVIFLVLYGIKSLYDAFTSKEKLDTSMASKGSNKSFIKTVTTAFAFSILNPHVVIDTTLMGALSIKYYPNQWYFGIGAMISAFLWFTLLGVLGKYLAKYLNSLNTWKIIHILVAFISFYVAFSFFYHKH